DLRRAASGARRLPPAGRASTARRGPSATRVPSRGDRRRGAPSRRTRDRAADRASPSFVYHGLPPQGARKLGPCRERACAPAADRLDCAQRMAGGFEAAVDRTCGRWVAWVAGRPMAVLAGVAVVTVALAAFAALTMGINADPRTLVDPTLPFQVRQRELGRTFHSLADGILLVVDADSPSAAGRTADALGAELGARTDLFAEVDVPGGGPFFAKNALLYLSVDQVQDLTDRLSKVQPFLGAFARDQSLVGIADLLRQVLEAEREGRATGVDLGPVLDRVRIAVESVARGQRAPDPWGAAIMGAALPAEARQRLVAVRPARDQGEIQPGAPELVAVREAIAKLELPPDGPLKVRITGEPVMNGEELLAVATQTWRVAIISTILFTIAVVFALR